MDIALIITFVIMMVALSFIEYRKYNTILTPFIVLAIPYTIIIIYINVFGWHRNYFPVTLSSLWFAFMNIFVFWLAGQAIWSLNHGNFDLFNHRLLEAYVKKNRKWLLILVGIGIIAGIASFLHAVTQLGFNAMGTEVFQLKYRSGILGHAVLFAYPSFILLGAHWLRNKSKLELVFLLLMIIIILVTQVKYRIILLLLPTFYLAVFSKTIKKLTIKNIGAFVIAVFLIFITVYFIGFCVTLGFDRAIKLMQFTIFAFEDYVVAGPITLGSFLKLPEHSLPANIIYTVPINIYNFMAGSANYVNPIIKYFQPISSDFAIPNNTGTMFAPLYLCLGQWGALIFMTVLGLCSHLLYNLAFKQNSIVLIFLSSHLLAMLTVSFFGYHFHLLSLWEIAVAMILTGMIIRFPEMFSRNNTLE